MKKNTFAVLFCGILSNGIASAADYTLDTSSNLSVDYASDSGYLTTTESQWLGWSNWQQQTTATVLGTYQATSGQWYQTTQYTTTQSYDYSYQLSDYSSYREMYFQTASTGSAGDQYISLSLNASPTTSSYHLWASATTGTLTSSHFGLPQIIYPAAGVIADGTLNAVTMPSGWADFTGTVTNSGSLQAIVEATNGGSIAYIRLALYSDPSNVRILNGTSSSIVAQWQQDAAISAPVPEPETYAMFLTGLGIMGAIGRRRKQK